MGFAGVPQAVGRSATLPSSHLGGRIVSALEIVVCSPSFGWTLSDSFWAILVVFSSQQGILEGPSYCQLCCARDSVVHPNTLLDE